MNNKAKPKIEAIYPLSTMQTGLLFHHLTEKEDQGFLNVQCIIDGELSINILQKAWNLAIERHPVLRTSVHWEKIKKPIQVVIPNSKIDFNVLDWSDSATNEQQKKLDELKIINKRNGINFQKKPLSQISLVKIKPDSHYFIWSCHHLFLDGWSSSIIIKDVFTFYNALILKIEPELESIPTYKSYLNWLKQTDINDAKKFWIQTFSGFKNPFLFNQNKNKTSTLVKNHIKLSEESSLKVKNIAKNYQTTLNTLFQGFWSVIISKYSNSKDVAYGNTVSGRSGDFPNIELIAGMFANVIPVRTIIDYNLNIQDWLKTIQFQQLKARKFEHITINEITEWIDNNENTLFDSLFIFENFPWNDIQSGNLKIHSSKSGITTTYPLTLTIITGDLIEIDLLSNSNIFSADINNWILNRFEEIINILDKNKDISIKLLLNNITPIKFNNNIAPPEITKSRNRIVLPKNKTEVELLKIWKKILKKDTISTEDNFLEIGGKSLLAVRMFSMVNDNLNVQLSPTTLLKYQSIIKLAELINNEKDLKTENWNNVVPIRSEGDKVALFCLHAGGGHVFFYNLLAKYLDKNRPVYAIQPSGLFGKLPRHKSIEAMAADYVKEIRLAYPEGPYNLLVYCNTTAVGFEMSNILKTLGHKANLIVMDTKGARILKSDVSSKNRVLGFFKRFIKNPIRVVKKMITLRFQLYIKPYFLNKFGSTEAKNTTNTSINLVKIYDQYKWKPYNLDITLLVTKKENKLFNEEMLKSWEEVADDINIINIEGDHITLFDDPDVQLVAKALDEHLN